jgi:hypothetical protein
LKIIWEAIEQEQAGKEKAITEIKSGAQLDGWVNSNFSD